jgi:hypothetical protein
VPSNQLTLALEPEAASVYCLKVTAESMSCVGGSNIKIPGHQYIVADLGGIYVEICFTSKLPNNSVRPVSY